MSDLQFFILKVLKPTDDISYILKYKKKKKKVFKETLFLLF